uniref:Uncharacterized protein n=1 Tax=Glossina brevipalpis TaxID=37001 RepID=A0A1A9W9C7_9MUSC
MHSTTGNKIMTTTSQNKSPLLKTKTSSSASTINNATIVSKSDSLEIEEISKKISEHADALYRTWKNRGLVPPAEILEFYTVEAAQAAGASKEELQSTEGLQKLVNTFVIKDKEQRGKVKKTITATTTSTSTEVKTFTTTTVTNKNKLSDNVSSVTSLSSSSKMPTSSVMVSPISQNALTSTSTLIFNNSKQGISSEQQQNPTRLQLPVHETQNQYQPEPLISEKKQTIVSSKIRVNPKSSKPAVDILDSVTKSSTNLNANANTKKIISNIAAPHVTTKVPIPSNASAHLEKSLNFDIDLDLKLDLNLDVKQLSEIQTQNLRKIKDLLNQSNAKIPTKIPTLTNSNSSSQGREHSIKMKTSTKVTNITAPLIEDLRQRLKHNDGNDNETALEVTIASEMPANKKIKEMQRIKANDLNSKREKDLINAGEKLLENDKNAGKSASTSSSSSSSSSSSNSNSSSSSSSISSSRSINSGGRSCANNNSSGDINNSNASIITHTRTQPLLEITPPASTKTTTLTVNSSLTSPMDGQSNVNVDDINSNSSSHSSTTTMPTPIKVKTTRNSLSNGQEKNLRSNFLTRGSVAERVLMFEKCPDVRNAFLNIKRPDKVDTPPKVQQIH